MSKFHMSMSNEPSAVTDALGAVTVTSSRTVSVTEAVMGGSRSMVSVDLGSPPEVSSAAVDLAAAISVAVVDAGAGGVGVATALLRLICWTCVALALVL